VRQSVLAADYLIAMSGFFDRTFRVHDFYRGILDGVGFLATMPPEEGRSATDLLEELSIDSEEYDCIIAQECPPELASLDALWRATDALTQAAHDPAQRLERDDLPRF